MTTPKDKSHEGPYTVQTFPNAGTFNSRWKGMGRQGVLTTEMAAQDACLELNAAYAAGQAAPSPSVEQRVEEIMEVVEPIVKDYIDDAFGPNELRNMDTQIRSRLTSLLSK